MTKNPSTYQVASLDDIRQTIDALDNNIHDLLIERSMLIEQISAEKKKNNIQIVQPAREARMIRRLLVRHKGPLPQATIIRIWRELVGAVTMLQTGLKVAVYCKAGAEQIWDDARDYFGGALPMERVPNIAAALTAVRDGKVNFAVLPWPEVGDAQPWWRHLAEQGNNLNVITALPYCDVSGQNLHTSARALVVSQFGFSESGDDRSFLLLSVDSNTSRARILDVAEKSAIKILGLYTHSVTGSAITLHLMEVDGFYDAQGEKEKDMLGKFDDPQASIKALGGYPVAPNLQS